MKGEDRKKRECTAGRWTKWIQSVKRRGLKMKTVVEEIERGMLKRKGMFSEGWLLTWECALEWMS